ncbi:serine hydrolase [Flammeovirga sp. MY04]|uniref:serine hydrolase n=1 Tax=Flammeovirga sp. MY04 TaxID=1191459 RepID=UPI0008061612|nr:serine hydrolase [Flammeovirga sp. MY04]ANQ50616.1 serine hydrolase [Flammeovirga sp. MY04]
MSLSNRNKRIPQLLAIITSVLTLIFGNDLKASNIDSLAKDLSLDQKIGQLIYGISLNNESQLKDLGKDNQLGALLFDKYCKPSLQTYFKNLNKLPNKLPVLLGAYNQEGIQCFDEHYQFLPDNFNLGAIKSNAFTYNTYKGIADACRQHQLDFYIAESLSINPEKDHSYGFGEEEINIISKNHAALKGLNQLGIKPGTSFHYLKDLGDYKFREINTLKGLVRDSIQFIYPSKVAFEAPIFPSSVTTFLTDSLGYNGMIVSGNLSKGNNAKVTVDNAIYALKNGHDMIALSGMFQEVIKGITNAVNKGILSEDLIDKKVEKVLRFKKESLIKISEETNINYHAIAEESFEKSVTLLNNTDSIIPLSSLNDQKYHLISIGLNGTPDYFSNMLKKFVDFNYHSIESSSFSTAQVNLLLETCKDQDLVIINIVCHQKSSKHRFGVSYATEQLIEHLQEKKNVIVALHGDPAGLKYLSDSRNTIINYSTAKEAQEASVQLIAGAIDANGKLPIAVSNYKLYQGEKLKSLGRLGYGSPAFVGIDAEKLTTLVDSIAIGAIEMEATPGCQVVIAKDGKIIFEKAYGYFTYQKEIPVTNETVYDIASITKVASTTQAMMMLDYQDSVNVNQHLKYYLPETDTTNKGNIRLIQFMTHTAPLRGGYYFWGHVYDKETKKYDPTYISSYKKKNFGVEITPNLYATDSIKDCMWHWLLDAPLSTRRRYTKEVYRYWYSDLGYYFLQRTIEKITNKRLDQFVESNIYKPLGTRSLGYLPQNHGIDIKRIPPTEMDINYRQSLMKGLVHDPSAALMGGVAGHAGVFSNAHDLAILMQMNLQKGYYSGHQYFDEATLKKYNRQPYKRFKNRRGLGWDKPPLRGDEGNTSALAPKSTFGHTGFTGTCAWVDPDNNIVYIFLSNRVYPTARNNKLAKENIRENIQGAIYESMIDNNSI